MLYIGIDPGKHTGIAVWDPTEKAFLSVDTMLIHQALHYVEELRHMETARGSSIKVYFEDARQRTWLPKEPTRSDYRGKLVGSGSIKRDSTIWEDFCTDSRIEYFKVKPAPGMTKWDAEYFAKVTGWTKRTSNHARDAALLVMGR